MRTNSEVKISIKTTDGNELEKSLRYIERDQK
jgi:hypothetical protein